MVSLKKSLKNTNAKAIQHVFGQNIIWVVIVLITVGWFTDTLLEIVKEEFKNFEYTNTWLLIGSALVLFLIGLYSRSLDISEQFETQTKDPKFDEKEVLILTLSNFFARNGDYGERSNGYSLDELKVEQKGTKGKTIRELTQTPFNNNWLPILQAIQHYPNLKKVILLTTEGNKGSQKNFQAFKEFAQSYIDNASQMTITNHVDSGYVQKPHLKKPISSDDLEQFADTVLNILDNINKSKDMSLDKVAFDVTSGMASMSAILGSVSGNRGIFLHYTNTNSMESHEIDITRV